MEIVAFKNRQPPAQRHLAAVSDVEAAVPATLERGPQFFADIELNQMDEMGRTALTWLAQQGAGHWAEVAAFAAILPEQKASETLLKLSQRKLLKANNGKFMIAVELIRRWFAVAS